MVKKYNIGCIFKTNEGYDIEIIKIINTKRRLIRFLTDNPYELEVDISSINKGTIRNLFHKRYLGVGYIGLGDFTRYLDGKDSKVYITWGSMLTRCYSNKRDGLSATYENVTVHKDWHNFSNFAKWYDENYPKHVEGIDFELDKDLLQNNKKFKEYSDSNCIFLPKSINKFISNKVSSNTSGQTGVSWSSKDNKWQVNVSLFGENKRKFLGYFHTIEEAKNIYIKHKLAQDEKARQYLRSLNYLPEEIIQLVRTV